MSSKINRKTNITNAELKFRMAFERLKTDKPEILSKGTPVSQNNVAKEAGVDASALRRSRYPKLIEEIKAYIKENNSPRTISSTKQLLTSQRASNRKLRERIKIVEAQRDNAMSKLLEAESKVLFLNQKVESLKNRIPAINQIL